MRLCVVVTMYVVTSVAFADDVVWESGLPPSLAPEVHGRDLVPVPKDKIADPTKSDVQPHDTQTQPKETVSSTEHSSSHPSDTKPGTVDQDKEEELRIERAANAIAAKGNEIQETLVKIGIVTIITQVLLTLAQLYFIWIANEHAAKAAKAAQDSVDVAREAFQTVQRAYLGTESWKFRNDKAGIPIRIDVPLYNSGTSPAKVIGTAWSLHLVVKLPPPPDYSRIVIRPMKPLLIHPKKEYRYAANLVDLLTDSVKEEIRRLQPAATLVNDKALYAMTMKVVQDGKMTLYLSGGIVYETVGLCLL
jgi:hypothetical protein